jgi:hypothetical protein
LNTENTKSVGRTKSKLQESKMHCYFDAEWIALSIAAFTCAVRPTNLLVWLVLGLLRLKQLLSIQRLLFRFFLRVLIVAFFFCAITMTIDRYFYGNWVFVPWNFVRFNLVMRGSELYIIILFVIIIFKTLLHL